MSEQYSDFLQRMALKWYVAYAERNADDIESIKQECLTRLDGCVKVNTPVGVIEMKETDVGKCTIEAAKRVHPLEVQIERLCIHWYRAWSKSERFQMHRIKNAVNILLQGHDKTVQTDHGLFHCYHYEGKFMLAHRRVSECRFWEEVASESEEIVDRYRRTNKFLWALMGAQAVICLGFFAHAVYS